MYRKYFLKTAADKTLNTLPTTLFKVNPKALLNFRLFPGKLELNPVDFFSITTSPVGIKSTFNFYG